MDVHALFSCLEPSANKMGRLTERLQARRVEFYVLNTIGGRVLISLLGGRNDLEWMVTKFTDLQLDPKVIAAYRADNGRKLKGYPIDRQEWRAVAPDVQTGTDPNGEPVYGRPSLGDYRQTHGWLGHPLHDDNDED